MNTLRRRKQSTRSPQKESQGRSLPAERAWMPAIMLKTVTGRVGFTWKKGANVFARWSIWAKSWEVKRRKWVGDPTSAINNVCGGVPRKSFKFV